MNPKRSGRTTWQPTAATVLQRDPRPAEINRVLHGRGQVLDTPGSVGHTHGVLETVLDTHPTSKPKHPKRSGHTTWQPTAATKAWRPTFALSADTPQCEALSQRHPEAGSSWPSWPKASRHRLRAGSWTGPPRGERAPRAGISSTVFGVRASGPHTPIINAPNAVASYLRSPCGHATV